MELNGFTIRWEKEVIEFDLVVQIRALVEVMEYDCEKDAKGVSHTIYQPEVMECSTRAEEIGMQGKHKVGRVGVRVIESQKELLLHRSPIKIVIDALEGS